MVRVVLDERAEKFCMLVAQGKKQTEAARVAGYPAPGAKATKLMAKAEIRSRVAALASRLTSRKLDAVIRFEAPTREYVLRGLIDNVESAREANDRGSVNKGLELVGKEIGMFVQRSMQIDSPLQRLPAAKLTELLRLIDETLEVKPAAVLQSSATARHTFVQDGTIKAAVEPLTIEGTVDDDSATDDGW